MRILVIDDDVLLRRTVTKILVAAGHEVLNAENGRQGMAVFRASQPQVVVTDIVMPEQEGIETIVSMRRENPKIRIIAISGGGQVGGLDVLKMAQMLGADDVIEKPFRAAELVARVAALEPSLAAASGVSV
jgi:DNA-binding response OmpR family regulator